MVSRWNTHNQGGFSLIEISIALLVSSIVGLGIAHIAVQTKMVEIEVSTKTDVDKSHHLAAQSARNSSWISRQLQITNQNGNRLDPMLDRCLLNRLKAGDNCSSYAREVIIQEALPLSGNRHIQNVTTLRLNCARNGCLNVVVDVQSRSLMGPPPQLTPTQVRQITPIPDRVLASQEEPQETFDYSKYSDQDSQDERPGAGSDDQLPGGESRDQLPGGKSRDQLPGGESRDQLPGGKSRDQLPGGGRDNGFLMLLAPSVAKADTATLRRTQHQETVSSEQSLALAVRSTNSEYPTALFAPISQIDFNCPPNQILSHIDLQTREGVCQPVLSVGADACANQQPMTLFGGSAAQCQRTIASTCSSGFGAIGLYSGQSTCANVPPSSPSQPVLTPTPTPTATPTPGPTSTPVVATNCTWSNEGVLTNENAPQDCDDFTNYNGYCLGTETPGASGPGAHPQNICVTRIVPRAGNECTVRGLTCFGNATPTPTPDPTPDPSLCGAAGDSLGGGPVCNAGQGGFSQRFPDSRCCSGYARTRCPVNGNGETSEIICAVGSFSMTVKCSLTAGYRAMAWVITPSDPNCSAGNTFDADGRDGCYVAGRGYAANCGSGN